MPDLRVPHVASVQPAPVNADAQDRGSHREQQDHQRRALQPGAEELAVALSAAGRGPMRAQYEEDATGNPQIRIVDVERGETVAVMSPEQLRVLAEQTGLPAGLLLHTAS